MTKYQLRKFNKIRRILLYFQYFHEYETSLNNRENRIVLAKVLSYRVYIRNSSKRKRSLAKISFNLTLR